MNEVPDGADQGRDPEQPERREHEPDGDVGILDQCLSSAPSVIGCLDPRRFRQRSRDMWGRDMWERRALQVSIALAASLPVVSGLWDITHAPSGDGWADNHHRYLSGLLLAIGLGYWSAVPRIEANAGRLRLLTAVVVVGGLARLAGLALGDAPTPPVMAALVMELAVAPLLCLWQNCVIVRSRPVSWGLPD
jgi:hypothetical protein